MTHWRMAVVLAVVAALAPRAAPAGTWSTAGLTFSDELGGMRLISVSGSGTLLDPVVIVEELTGMAPATLVVRSLPTRRRQTDPVPTRAYVDLAVIKIVINRSRKSWAGFDLELQEVLGKPSTYGDGLSFDQIRQFKGPPTSDRFFDGRLVDEPYDRIRFYDGMVDPGETVRFNLYITDPTPADEFFLVQEPRILIAGRPPPGRLAQAPGGRVRR